MLLGLTTAVKWSGAYWIVAFGVLTVIWDITARREAGIRRPVRAVVRRDLVPNLWALGVVPLLTYIAQLVGVVRLRDRSGRGTPGGRRRATAGTGRAATLYDLASLWSNELWQWTWKMLDFHSHLLTPTDPAKRHPWESKPWTWPLGTRPVLYYSPANGDRLRRRAAPTACSGSS